jgi:hypothetical protein
MHGKLDKDMRRGHRTLLSVNAKKTGHASSRIADQLDNPKKSQASSERKLLIGRSEHFDYNLYYFFFSVDNRYQAYLFSGEI